MAASRRQSGSDRGRASVDWEQLFLFYAALPAHERSYQAVADAFCVSVRTVEAHGARDRWKERVRAIAADAAAAAAARLSEQRAAKLVEVEKLIDASYLTYAQDLRRGAVRVAPADLARLHKLRQELWNDAAAEQPSPNMYPAEGAQAVTVERKLEVLRVLQEAGALRRLQQLVDPTRTDAASAATEGGES